MTDIDAAFANKDENEPNFAIREIAPIQSEYTHNKREIGKSKRDIEGNDFLIAQTLAHFNRINDSLNALVEKNKQKLKWHPSPRRAAAKFLNKKTPPIGGFLLMKIYGGKNEQFL